MTVGRHKGAQPIQHQRIPWGPAHPVARSISTGSDWFGAWRAQMCTPTHRLTKLTGLSEERLRQIERGARFTRAELAVLAGAWRSTPADIEASLPDRHLLTD